MKKLFPIFLFLVISQWVLPQVNSDLQAPDRFYFHNIRSGVESSGNAFLKNGKGVVAFLGGSITYNHGWRDSICQYLTKNFPKTEFEFINAGIPSMGSTPDAFRLERDVLSKSKIDLLFVDCAVNDRTNGRTSQERIRATEGIIRHSLVFNPNMDIVLLYFADPWKMEDYRCGNVPAEIQDYEKVANHYNIATNNIAKEVTSRIAAGEFTWENDFIDLHPSPFGQGIYARSIEYLLDMSFNRINGKNKVSPRKNLPEKIDEFCYDKGSFISIWEYQNIRGWSVFEGWKPDDGAGTRAGYVNVPMLVANTPNAELNIEFQGRAIGMVVAAGPDAGKIEYCIDKGVWKKLDLFTKWSENLHLPWYYLLDAELTEQSHILKIRVSGERNHMSVGNACRIAHFFVNK